ncbi:unnamed protein product [Caenorhabditis sp. 36 PRJEB53466]|nr:unnamed protein product [Caenorhabditis sp. 36 PRJEB53466]
MPAVSSKTSMEKFLRRIAPQAIILLILAAFMSLGAVIFRKIDPSLAEEPFYKVLFFEFITISTIGYGNQFPQTAASKAFVIGFSLIGIPLLIVTLGNFGKYLTKFYWKAQGCLFKTSTERQLVNDRDLPFPVILTLYVLTFFIGFFFIPHSGAAYSVDDYYFSFISFATVGFGDMTPDIGTFEKFLKVSAYLVWGTILNIILISYLTNCFSQMITRQPFLGRDVEVAIGGQFITVSEITSLVAKQFHASPHEVRSMLHEIDDMMDEMQKKEESDQGSDIIVQ